MRKKQLYRSYFSLKFLSLHYTPTTHEYIMKSIDKLDKEKSNRLCVIFGSEVNKSNAALLCLCGVL